MKPLSLSVLVQTIALTLVSMLALTSCEATPTPYRNLDADKTGHMESGFLFPEELGDFTRGEVRQYDGESPSIGVTYTRFHLVDRVNASIFVSTAPPLRSWGSPPSVVRSARKVLFQEAFEVVKQNIMSASPGATLVFVDETAVDLFGQRRETLTANFTYTTKVQGFDIPFFTTASLIDLDHWLVLVRITAANDSYGRSLEQVFGFFQAMLEANDGAVIANQDGTFR